MVVVVPDRSPVPVVVVEEPDPWTPRVVDVVVDPDDPRTVVVDELDELLEVPLDVVVDVVEVDAGRVEVVEMAAGTVVDVVAGTTGHRLVVTAVLSGG